VDRGAPAEVKLQKKSLLSAPQACRATRRVGLRTLASVTLFFWLLVGVGATPGAAHPAINEQIERVSGRLAKEPQSASLYFKRGQLHQAHRAWDAAIADYQRAADLDGDLQAARIQLSEVLLEAGRVSEAKQVLDKFLSEAVDHVDGLVLRGRINLRLGDFNSAGADYERAIRLSANAQPDWFLERARALAEVDANLERALAGLDEGLMRLGPLVTLQGLAIELELRRKNHDAALARVDRLLAPMPRQPHWLVKRGELLTRLGRPREARASYETALQVIAALPANRRSAKVVLELAQQATKARDDLDAALSTANFDKE
jgi:tetratricopeptide (TPR) repeat protein